MLNIRNLHEYRFELLTIALAGTAALLTGVPALQRLVSRLFDSAPLRRTCFGVLLIVLCATSMLYFAKIGYSDHIEPTVVSVGWIALNGGPIHPPLADGGPFYGMLYGPLTYELAAIGFLISPSIAGSKIAFVAAYLLSLLLVFLAFRGKDQADLRRVAVWSGIFLISAFGYAAFWVRPDPGLVLLACLGLFAVLRTGALTAAAIIGAAAGLAVGLKLHGPLYLFPFFVYLVLTPAEWGARARLTLMALVGFAAGADVQFLAVPGADPLAYLDYIAVGSRHGFARPEALRVAFLAITIVLPPVVAAASGWARSEARERWLLGSFLVCLALAAVAGSKIGAGGTHLLPLVPSAILAAYLFQLRAEPGRASLPMAFAKAAAILVFLLFAPGWAVRIANLANDALRGSGKAGIVAETEAFIAAYPGIAMGIGGNDSHSLAEYRVLTTIAAGDLPIDPAAWMDLQYATDVNPLAVPIVAECRVRAFLIPVGGAPFSIEDFYSRRPAFSEEFGAAFLRRYRHVETGRYFEVWTC